MVLVAIGTAGAISAYFVGRFFSSYSFGCGLVFWVSLLLWPKLRISGDRTGLYNDPQQMDIRRVAKPITVITIVNLCGCLGVPYKKLPLLVRFLVLFQMSSIVALLLILAINFTVKKYIMSSDVGTSQGIKSRRRKPQAVAGTFQWTEILQLDGSVKKNVHRNTLTVNAMVFPEQVPSQVVVMESDPRLSSSESAEASAGRDETTRTSTTIPTVHGGAGDADETSGSGSGHGSSGGEENRGVYGINGRERGGANGGREGDLESGERGRNGEQSFKVSKVSEMSIMVTAQTTGTLVSFHLSTPSYSTKVLLLVALVNQLVAYKHHNSDVAHIFAHIGFACTALGYILMVAMFLQWYVAFIVVLLFGVFFLFIYFGLDWLRHVVDAVRQ